MVRFILTKYGPVASHGEPNRIKLMGPLMDFGIPILGIHLMVQVVGSHLMDLASLFSALVYFLAQIYAKLANP